MSQRRRLVLMESCIFLLCLQAVFVSSQYHTNFRPPGSQLRRLAGSPLYSPARAAGPPAYHPRSESLGNDGRGRAAQVDRSGRPLVAHASQRDFKHSGKQSRYGEHAEQQQYLTAPQYDRQQSFVQQQQGGLQALTQQEVQYSHQQAVQQPLHYDQQGFHSQRTGPEVIRSSQHQFQGPQSTPFQGHSQNLQTSPQKEATLQTQFEKVLYLDSRGRILRQEMLPITGSSATAPKPVQVNPGASDQTVLTNLPVQHHPSDIQMVMNQSPQREAEVQQQIKMLQQQPSSVVRSAATGYQQASIPLQPQQPPAAQPSVTSYQQAMHPLPPHQPPAAQPSVTSYQQASIPLQPQQPPAAQPSVTSYQQAMHPLPPHQPPAAQPSVTSYQQASIPVQPQQPPAAQPSVTSYQQAMHPLPPQQPPAAQPSVTSYQQAMHPLPPQQPPAAQPAQGFLVSQPGASYPQGAIGYQLSGGANGQQANPSIGPNLVQPQLPGMTQMGPMGMGQVGWDQTRMNQVGMNPMAMNHPMGMGSMGMHMDPMYPGMRNPFGFLMNMGMGHYLDLESPDSPDPVQAPNPPPPSATSTAAAGGQAASAAGVIVPAGATAIDSLTSKPVQPPAVSGASSAAVASAVVGGEIVATVQNVGAAQTAAGTKEAAIGTQTSTPSGNGAMVQSAPAQTPSEARIPTLAPTTSILQTTSTTEEYEFEEYELEEGMTSTSVPYTTPTSSTSAAPIVKQPSMSATDTSLLGIAKLGSNLKPQPSKEALLRTPFFIYIMPSGGALNSSHTPISLASSGLSTSLASFLINRKPETGTTLSAQPDGVPVTDNRPTAAIADKNMKRAVYNASDHKHGNDVKTNSVTGQGGEGAGLPYPVDWQNHFDFFFDLYYSLGDGNATTPAPSATATTI